MNFQNTRFFKSSFLFILGLSFIFIPTHAKAQNFNTKSNININENVEPRFLDERYIDEKAFTAERLETKEIVIDPQNQIFKILQSGRIDDVRFKNLNALQEIYAENNYQPIFITNNRRAQDIVNDYYNVILDSWSHGLNPNRYHSQALYKFLSTSFDQISDDTIIKADIILTDAIIRLGQDLTGARIIPSKLNLHAPSINQGVLAREIVQFVKKSRNPNSAFEDIAPQSALYRMMRDELVRLYTTNEHQENFISVSGLVKPRTSHPAIPQIRQRMGSRSDNLAQDDRFYDDELASAIMAFQRTNGLNPDGVIGPATLQVMNLSIQDKIEKLIVNMERIRWDNQKKPKRYILVNIPNERLWAVENGATQIEMAVVVGRPKRPTIAFNSNITGVRINPTWTIPPTIKREDFVTKLRKDAAYLDNRGIKLYKNGQEINSTSINWANIGDNQLGAFKMVQGPSSSNPLGRFRVLMDNPYDIYLHDTPTKSNFAQSNRALSSGCVRMEDAEAVTDFILKTNPQWSESRKAEILQSGRMKEVSAGENLPVFLKYRTIWMGADNQLIYGNDLYDEDSALYSALKKQNDIFVPQNI